MAISHQRVPHGGWKYYQERTRTTIAALDHASLVKQVSDHRRNNGIDVGDVEEDIDQQIEKNQPQLTI